MSTPERIGLFAGSFDPFTIGHADLVDRALRLVDRLQIVVGVNLLKETTIPADERVRRIAKLYAGEPRITVAAWEGLTAHYAKQVGATILIRGLRSAGDLEREREMADTNLSHFGLDTLFLLSRPELASVSSSMVRELTRFGEPPDPYLPHHR